MHPCSKPVFKARNVSVWVVVALLFVGTGVGVSVVSSLHGSYWLGVVVAGANVAGDGVGVRFLEPRRTSGVNRARVWVIVVRCSGGSCR